MSDRIRLAYEVWRRRQRGESIRAISRALGIARKTIRRMLREVQQRRAQGDDALERMLPPKRAPRGSKLDSWAGFIAEQLHRYPDLRATRLHEMLVAQGFDGGYTIVREHLKKIRPNKRREEPFVMVTTGPGRQAQTDWSPYKLADGSVVYCFSCVLGHSRYMYASLCRDSRQVTVFRQLRRAFDAFGGVPGEIVFDTMPGIIDRWEAGVPIFNLGAIDFAVYMDFELHAAPRGKGNYKGKVERPFRYIEESFFNGRTFYNFEQASDAFQWWLEHRANPRTHRTTKRIPAEVLREEREHLGALPRHPYDDRELALRVIDSYGYVNFDGNHYRAPKAIGTWVYLRASEDEVTVVGGVADVIARHPRAARNAGAHVPPPPSKRPRRPTGELLSCLENWSPEARRYGEVLLRRKRYGGAQLAHICSLQKTYTIEDIVAAIAHAHRYGAYGARKLERILEVRADPRSFEDRMADSARAHIREAMSAAPVRQRSLADYTRLLGHNDDDGDGDGDIDRQQVEIATDEEDDA